MEPYFPPSHWKQYPSESDCEDCTPCFKCEVHAYKKRQGSTPMDGSEDTEDDFD